MTIARRGFLAGGACLIAAPALPAASPAQERLRVLSLGGSVTEIVHALGAADRLIGRDSTSTFPPEVTELPDVGYLRALSPEGVLSVAPDLILAEDDAGPPEVLEILRAADIPVVTVPEATDAEGLRAKIIAVADALDLSDEGAILAEETVARLETAREAASGGDPARVLFILSMAGGRIMGGGADTTADAMIGLAGGRNALEGVEGYKPLTDEAVTAAAPEVIVMMDRGGGHGADDETLFSHPALITSPAAASRAVVRMDGLLLLGFGPRTPEAVEMLSGRIAAMRGG